MSPICLFWELAFVHADSSIVVPFCFLVVLGSLLLFCSREIVPFAWICILFVLLDSSLFRKLGLLFDLYNSYI